MTDKDFDKIFRDRLAEHGTPVDAGMWSAIESGLNGQKSVPVGLWAKLRRIRRIAGYAASVAAIFVVAFMLLKPQTQLEQESQPYIHQEGTGPIAISDENPSEPKNNQPIEKAALALKRAVALSASSHGLETEPSEPEKVQEHGRAAVGKTGETEKTGEASDVAATKAANDVADGNSQYSSGEYMADLGLPNTCKCNSKEYSFSLFSNLASNGNMAVTPQYLSTMAASGISHTNTALQTMEIISEAKYSLPVNLGVQAQVKVNDLVSVGVGVSYTCLKSKYDGLINKKFHRIKQSLHYIGIPVNVYFRLFEKNRFRFYANAGGAIEKGIRASYRVTSYDGTSFSSKAKIDGFQCSANAGFGLEYRFSSPVSLYLEPNVVYFFDSEIPASIRTSQPLQVKAEIGFRFHLNR